MKTQSRAIILLQCLRNKEDFNFSSTLLTNIRVHSGQNDVIFSADNFSDQLTIHSAQSLIDREDEVIIICDLEDCEHLGSNQPILNHALRRQKARLYSKGEPSLLRPFMKFLNGVVFSSEEEIVAILRN